MINLQELVFAVDEHNQPIQPVERRVAHATGVWHRVAHILVYRADGAVLCEQRSLLKDLSPGKWECIFGGHLSPGQNARAGAAMELYEETGIRADEAEFVEFKLHKFIGDRVREFQYVYILRWDGSDEDLRPEPEEVEQLAWRPREEVARLVAPPSDWVQLGYEPEAMAFIGRLLARAGA